MGNKLSPVYTLKNECHDCYKCVRECYVKSIQIKDGSASVLADRCIACGHCVTVCPSNAKRIRYDVDKVKGIFATGKKVVVSLAPSWISVFDYTKQQMITVLKALGFSDVSETALGAQEVSIEVAKLIKESEKGLFISSACPVIVDYIRYYKPEYAKYITPVASPALTHAKMLKEQYGEDISVVFIGPCIAKKNESDKNSDLIDVALTFDELNYWIKESYIDLAKIEVLPDEDFVPNSANEGALYPVLGGMNETLKFAGIEKDVQLLDICTLHSLDKALNGLHPERLEEKIFLEALGCDGGCINGPGISMCKSTILKTSDVLNNFKKRESIPATPKTVVEMDYSAIDIKKREFKHEEIMKTMERIGKHNEEDELNCGGCGFQTCRELACAILAGEAEPSMCVSYMRKIALRKAAAMLRCMPSAMVMIDNKNKILESNDAFMKMFTGEMYDVFSERPEGVNGADIDRIIPFSDLLTTALKTGKDIHKEHYVVGNKLYDINIFIIEEKEIVGAIITDVTQSELNREKIAERAKEVISKNIAKVQEIAILLGEHMVETELLLSTIADDYTTDDKDSE
mgnify:FL=1